MTEIPQQPQPYPPQPYPPGYPPPGYYVPAVQQRTNGLAIASLVLGIVWIYWIGSILALIFGYVAKRQIRQSNGTQSGDGMATAGIVLGWVGVAALIVVILIIIGVASDSSTNY